MGFLDKLRGESEMERQWRRHDREQARKEAADAKRESERDSYRTLMISKARKEGRDRARYSAEGGFIGSMFRGMNSTAKSGGKVAVKALKAYQKSAKKKSKSDYMAPIRPMGMGGYSTMPNVDNVMPDFMRKKRE